jgi:serine/threonine protein kinase
MIIHGAYFGDKADIWSIGCILLELILGHERFCDLWMVSYDYELLQDKTTFTEAIEDAIDKLPSSLNFSAELNDFIIRLLQLRSTNRPNVRSIATHSWLKGSMDDELAALRAAKLALNAGFNSPIRLSSPPGGGNNYRSSQSFNTIMMPPSQSVSPSTLTGSLSAMGNSQVDTELLKSMFRNLSDRERKQMEDYVLRYESLEQQMHLPPIEPVTPSIGKARKFLPKTPSELGEVVASNGRQQFFPASPQLDFASPLASIKPNAMLQPLRFSMDLGRHTPLPGLQEILDDTVTSEKKYSPIVISKSQSSIT